MGSYYHAGYVAASVKPPVSVLRERAITGMITGMRQLHSIEEVQPRVMPIAAREFDVWLSTYRAEDDYSRAYDRAWYAGRPLDNAEVDRLFSDLVRSADYIRMSRTRRVTLNVTRREWRAVQDYLWRIGRQNAYFGPEGAQPSFLGVPVTVT